MYHEFFGLKEPAFSIAVNPRYLYMSAQHREALAHLLYGIQNGGFVMLTGEVGTGKTTLVRCLLEQLPPATDMAIILNPMASAPELLSAICDELGIAYENSQSIKNLTDVLSQFLLENHRQGRKTVLLIDEAQLLKVPVLEQIRLLTNLETTTEKLLQIILVGQPELKAMLALPELRQLSQRITARFHLEALTLPETQVYIAHRLAVAGMSPGLVPFTPEVIRRIHRYSGGIPRLINVLCERLLLGAYAKHQYQVDSQVLRQSLAEVSGANAALQVKPQPLYRYGPWVVAIVTLLLAIWLWRLPLTNTALPPEPAALVAEPSPALGESQEANDGVADEVVDDAGANELLLTDEALWALGWRDNPSALAELASLWPLASDGRLCGQANYRCERQTLRSWDELRDINRPGLLTLLTAEKKAVYVLMIGLSETRVLLQKAGQVSAVSWEQLSPWWSGEFLYAWSHPAGFPATLQQGDQGEAVTWLAEQFAQLDKQSAR